MLIVHGPRVCGVLLRPDRKKRGYTGYGFRKWSPQVIFFNTRSIVCFYTQPGEPDLVKCIHFLRYLRWRCQDLKEGHRLPVPCQPGVCLRNVMIGLQKASLSPTGGLQGNHDAPFFRSPSPGGRMRGRIAPLRGGRPPEHDHRPVIHVERSVSPLSVAIFHRGLRFF